MVVVGRDAGKQSGKARWAQWVSGAVDNEQVESFQLFVAVCECMLEREKLDFDVKSRRLVVPV